MFFPYSQKSNILDLYPILLNGLNLPYVSNGNGILQEFYFAHAGTKCLLMWKYCTSFRSMAASCGIYIVKNSIFFTNLEYLY